MVDLPLILFPQTVYKCMQKDLREGNKQIEEEPSVHHLDIRRLGEALRDADEQGREDKKRGKIHCHYGFKEESFEIVSAKAHNAKKCCGQVCGKNCGQHSAPKNNMDFH